MTKLNHEVVATVINSGEDGTSCCYPTEGWSSESETDPARRGLVVSISDHTEVIIPFQEIRKFYNYMVLSGF